MSISSSIFILIIIIIRWVGVHKLPKKTFLAFWIVALFQLLIPFYIPVHIETPDIASRILGFPPDSTNTQISMPHIVTIPDFLIEISNVDVAIFEVLVNNIIPVSPLVLVWIVGLIGLSLFFIITHLRSYKERRAALPLENDIVDMLLKEHELKRTIQIKQSDRISTPLTYGLFRPVILFPKTIDWSNEIQLRFILTHELTHIKHFDILTKWLLVITLCIHWFNPFVWAMYILANRDIELTCDESVVRTFGETKKSTYALILIGMAERKGGISFLYNNFATNAIEERITAIMKMKKNSIFRVLLAFLMIFVMAFSTLVVSAQEIPVVYTFSEVDTPLNMPSINLYSRISNILSVYSVSGLHFEIEFGEGHVFATPLFMNIQDYQNFRFDESTLHEIRAMVNAAYHTKMHSAGALLDALGSAMPELGQLFAAYVVMPELAQRITAYVADAELNIVQPFTHFCCDPFIIVQELVMFGVLACGTPIMVWRNICRSCRRPV